MAGPSPHLSTPDLAGLFNGVACVIFDFDGVVADSETHSLGTLRDALAAFGVEMPLDEVRARFLGKSLTAIDDYVAEHGRASAATSFAEAWQDKLYAAFRADLSALPHLEALLDGLDRAGRRYCVASSSSFERLGVALDAMQLADRFPNLFSAEQVAQGKPAPDLFLFAARHMQASPETCLVIEDSPYGLRAAKAAGIPAIGFVGGAHLRDCRDQHAELMRREGADIVTDSHAALLAALGH